MFSPALLLVFSCRCLQGGVLYEAVKPVLESEQTISNTVAVVTALREKGVTIMHAPITFTSNYRELGNSPYGILKGVVDGKAFLADQFGGAIIDQLKPDAERDIVIAGKRGLDCFASTNLDFILRSKGIKNVALAGLLTNCCVESTMRSAYEAGYNVFTLTDCTAATSLEAQAAAVKFTYPMFSNVTTGAQFVENVQ